MSAYKDLWIERYDEEYLRCIDEGMSEAEALASAEHFAEGTAEFLVEHADAIRRAARDGEPR